MTVSSQCRWWYQRSPRQTGPAFPRTRHLLPISVPFWFGFEADSATDGFTMARRFSSVVFATLTLESCLPISTNGKLCQNSTRSVSPATAPAVISHSRLHLSFSLSSERMVRNNPFRRRCAFSYNFHCCGDFPLDCTQRSFVLVVARS